MNEKGKTIATYQKIMEVLIMDTQSTEYSKFITYSGIHRDSNFIRIDVIDNLDGLSRRNAIKEKLKENFDIDCKEGIDIDGSRRFKNKNDNRLENMRIVVFPNYIEVGIYTGKYYDCEVIYERQ